MPGMYPASGLPFLSVPWSLSRMPTTAPFSMSGALTGVPGQIWTVPEAITFEPTHWVNCPMEVTSPWCLARNGGMQGSSKACSRETGRRARSSRRSGLERRLAPRGSSRWTTFSLLTWVVMGMAAGSRSGKERRMARARVTTPETP